MRHNWYAFSFGTIEGNSDVSTMYNIILVCTSTNLWQKWGIIKSWKLYNVIKGGNILKEKTEMEKHWKILLLCYRLNNPNMLEYIPEDVGKVEILIALTDFHSW